MVQLTGAAKLKIQKTVKKENKSSETKSDRVSEWMESNRMEWGYTPNKNANKDQTLDRLAAT